MANTILIKRGSGTPTTSNTSAYELAYDYTNDKLYIHDGASSSMVEITGSSGTITGVTGMTNNNVLTASGSTTISGEGSLTFGGSHLKLLVDSGKFLAGANEDAYFMHSGNHMWLNNNTGNLYIRNQTDDGQIIMQTDDGTGNTTTYMSLKGNEQLIRFLKSTRHNDGVVGQFGTSADLRIYHNAGGNTNIENHSGDLYFTEYTDDGSIYFRSDNGSNGVANYLQIDGNTTNLLLTPPSNITRIANDGGASDEPKLQLYRNNAAYGQVHYEPGGGANSGFHITDFRDDANSHIIFNTRGDNERMRIESDGKVGIGITSSLAAKLHVVDSDGSNLARFKDSDSSYAGIIIAADTNGGHVGNSGGYAGEGIYFQDSLEVMRFYTAGSERMRLDSGGRLAIGSTTAQGAKLRLFGVNAGNWNDGLIIDDSSGWAATIYKRDNVPKMFTGLYSGNDNYIWMSSNYSNSGTTITAPRADAVLMARPGTDDLQIYLETHFGNKVGIGTTSPSTKMHIQGSAISGSSSDANSLLTLTNNANNSIQINSSSSSAGQIRFGHNSSNYRGAMTYYHSSNILGFTTSGTERVRIDTTGAKFSENFGSTDDVLHINPSNGGNRTMTIDGQKIDVTFTNSGGSTGLELQGNGGSATFGGAVKLQSELDFTGNGNKIIDVETLENSNSFRIRNHNPVGNVFHDALKLVGNGGAHLYYNNSKKIETTNTGATVTGALNVTGALSFGSLSGAISTSSSINTNSSYKMDNTIIIDSSKIPINIADPHGTDRTGSVLVTDYAGVTSPTLSGWYTIAKGTVHDARGGGIISIGFTGGYASPKTFTCDFNVGWSGELHRCNISNETDVITKVRLITTSSTTELQAYFVISAGLSDNSQTMRVRFTRDKYNPYWSIEDPLTQEASPLETREETNVNGRGVKFYSSDTNTFEINNSNVVINELSKNVDFRVEGNGDANLLFTDGGNDRVGIGTNSPDSKLTIKSAGTTSQEVIKIRNSSNTEVLSVGIDSGGDGYLNFNTSPGTINTNGGHLLLSPGGSGNVGIGVTPTHKLHVNGDLRVVGKVLGVFNTGFVSTDSVGNQATLMRQTSGDIMLIGDTNHTEQIKIQSANSTGNGYIHCKNDGGIGFSGNTSFSSPMTVNYGAVFNEGGNNSDFRVESENNPNMFKVDADQDVVLTAKLIDSATHLGTVGGHGLEGNQLSTTDWANLPVGFGGMMRSGNQSYGNPGSNYFLFHKIANRDSGGGWGGIAVGYNSNADFYVGHTTVSGSYATWSKVWNEANDGAGSGLDADTVDGVQATNFVRKGNTAENNTSNRTTFNSLNAIESSSGHQSSLEVFNSSAGNDAFMQFHVSSDFALYFGLDGSTNDLSVGGWSMGSNKYRVFHAGNSTNITSVGTINTGVWNGTAIASAYLDADTAHLSTTQTFTGAKTFGTQTWNGHITWNNGKNIYVAGESSFDVSGSGYFQIWDSGTGAPFIKCDVGLQTEIGQAGSRGLKVHGTLNATADVVAYTSSDKKLKDNIKNIANPLDKLNKLNGVEFDWNDKQDLYKGHDIGVIAQEVEEVLPEIVDTREDGHKAVKYDRMVALLIEAVKEQQVQIDELKTKLGE